MMSPTRTLVLVLVSVSQVLCARTMAWQSLTNQTKNIMDLCRTDGTTCVYQPIGCQHSATPCQSIAALTNFTAGLNYTNPAKYQQEHPGGSFGRYDPSVGLFLFGKYNMTRRDGPQTAGLLAYKKNLDKGGHLYLCAQGYAGHELLVSSHWNVSSKLNITRPPNPSAPNFGLKQADTNLIRREEYIACAWSLRKDELPDDKFIVQFAQVNLVGLRAGSHPLIADDIKITKRNPYKTQVKVKSQGVIFDKQMKDASLFLNYNLLLIVSTFLIAKLF